MKLPLERAVEASEARVAGKLPDTESVAFSTDTRTLATGNVFVALRGERFDGHDYVREALAAGACAIVVDDEAAVPAGAPALVVDDTTRAYLAFGALARARSAAQVVAVTGSTGKTTTKAFLAQILARVQSGRVVATPANENNEIGVAKLLLSIPEDAAFVVVEFGARHFGDILPLARAASPDVAVLTNVGDAHLEIFGSQERLAQTKWDVFATGARRVLCGTDEHSLELAARAGTAVATTWFSIDAPRTVPNADAAVVLYGRDCLAYEPYRAAAPTVLSHTYRADVRVPGDHNRLNAAAAAAAAFELGFDGSAIASALGELVLPPGRYERIEVANFAVMHDAYNASMSGTLATLASFAREPASRRIAILGSMAELGADASDMHARVGAAVASGNVDVLLVGGTHADDLARGARDAGYDAERIIPFADNAEAVAWLREHARQGDLVLLKASRKYRLEEIVDGLRGAHAG